MQNTMTRQLLGTSILVMTCAVTTLSGCKRYTIDQQVNFEPNLVHAIKYEIREDISMDQASEDSAWVVETMFGTPDEPALPKAISENEDVATLVSMERLQRASGPDHDEARGLFRKHCVLCHGVTGNGRGPTGALQVPYPRDYRMGTFKFKSTPRGVKPTREDLAATIRNGIGGTAMKHIPELTEEDVQSLVDYVIYLTIRGELERTLMDEAIYDLDLEGGERILETEYAAEIMADPEKAEKLDLVLEDTDGETLVNYETYLALKKRLDADPQLKETLEAPTPDDEEADDEEDEQLASDRESYEVYQDMQGDLDDDASLAGKLDGILEDFTGTEVAQYERFRDSWNSAKDFAVEKAELWLEADDEIVEVPEPPTDFPVAESHADVVELLAGDQAQQIKDSIARGHELFIGNVASCSKCHGKQGLGDGETKDYDDWTKDWTKRVGLEPDDRDSLIPLLARGALPPRNIIPRNFTEGVFRGGSTNRDLYLRISQGIDGTPMPEALFVEGKYQPEDIWHLINFVRSLQTEEAEAQDDTTAAQPPA